MRFRCEIPNGLTTPSLLSGTRDFLSKTYWFYRRPHHCSRSVQHSHPAFPLTEILTFNGHLHYFRQNCEIFPLALFLTFKVFIFRGAPRCLWLGVFSLRDPKSHITNPEMGLSNGIPKCEIIGNSRERIEEFCDLQQACFLLMFINFDEVCFEIHTMPWFRVVISGANVM